MFLSAAGRQSPTLPAAPVTSVFYLFRDAPHRRAALELEPGSAGPLLALRDGPARRARIRGAAQPRASEALGLGADDGRGAEARPRGRGRLRRRLRDRPLVAPAAEPRRRRVLDRRHGGHPADAPRAGRRRAPAVRVLGDRAARAARAAPLRAHASGSTRGRSVRRPRSSPTASTRRTSLRDGSASGEQRRQSSSCRFGVDVEAFRADRRVRPTSTSSRSGRIPIATSSCSSTSRRRMPDTSFLVVTTAERARALDGHGRPTSRSRPTCRSTRCAAGSSAARVVALPVRDNSYSGATTVLLQAMALAKPVVVTRTSRDRDGLRARGRRERAGSWRPGTSPRSAGRWRRCCSDDSARASARRARARDRRARAHVGALRRADRSARSKRGVGPRVQ